jgi:Ca-activated chloride channel family protein
MPTIDTSSPPLQLILTPERAALVRGQENTVRVLVRVQAPDVPAGDTPRDPLHLALVLDRSGSMSGEPLVQAMRCARHMIEQLGACDRVAVYAFDDEIEQMAPLTHCTSLPALRAAIDSIEPGGSTNLHGGWRAGADELTTKLAGTDVHRVILLSDGCANHGETDLERITGQCRDMAKRGVTTSTYGLGRHFNEDLMLAMAKSGRGNAYYGDTAADLAEPFAAEFALLTSLCARGLVLKVNAPDGIGIRMRNDYEFVADGVPAWKLPDLAFASEAWAVVEFAIPAAFCSADTLSLPVTVSIEAAGRGSAPVFLMAPLAPLPVVDAKAAHAVEPDGLVVRRLQELDAADCLKQMRDALSEGDWQHANAVLEEARKRFSEHEWAASILAGMARLLRDRDVHRSRKEASFAAYSMNRRLSARDEIASFRADASAPAYLRRKPEQGKGRQ